MANESTPISVAVGRLLITYAVISGVLALAIVLSATIIPIYAAITGDSTLEVPEVIENWGGIIIGFYFGSALTQMSSLVAALTGGKDSTGGS